VSDDPTVALFRRGNKFDLPSFEVEDFADRMAKKGLLVVQRKTFVRCVNPLDRDQHRIKDSSCVGRIVVREDKDEDDYDYRCADCGRVVFPSRKHSFEMLITRPQNDAIRAFVGKALPRVDAEVREDPRGLFRIAAADGDVFVCYVDDCRDRLILDDADPRVERTVYVVGNERDYMARLPKRSRVFSLLGLALGHNRSTFQKAVRGLVGGNGRDADRPAVALRKPKVPWARSPAATREKYPGVTRIPVPRGTRWGDIEVYLIDGLTLAIRVPDSHLQQYTHEALGMANKRTKKPTRKWDIVEAVCVGRGVHVERWLPKEWNAFTTQVSDLRELLQYIFGLDTDPLPTCSREEGLKSAFQAFPDADEPPYVGEDQW
jgi:hypothetical protein